MRRRLRNLLPGHRDNALGGRLEAGYQTQQGSLSATGRPQNGYKLALADRQIHIIQYGFVSEKFRYVLYTDDAVGLLHKRFLLYPN